MAMTVNTDMETTVMQTSNVQKNALRNVLFVSWYCQAATVYNTLKYKLTAVSGMLLEKLVVFGLVKNVLTFGT
jgi:hypothetical protein